MTKWKVQFNIGASCFEDSFEADESETTSSGWLMFYKISWSSDGVNKRKSIVAMYKATDLRAIMGD